MLIGFLLSVPDQPRRRRKRLTPPREIDVRYPNQRGTGDASLTDARWQHSGPSYLVFPSYLPLYFFSIQLSPSVTLYLFITSLLVPYQTLDGSTQFHISKVFLHIFPYFSSLISYLLQSLSSSLSLLFCMLIKRYMAPKTNPTTLDILATSSSPSLLTKFLCGVRN